MGKMIYLMGKSSTGKDTIYKHLLQWKEIPFEKVVLYTTRPIRAHEKNGREYHFTDEVHYQELLKAGKIIEDRVYQTFYGPWRYFTVDDGSIDLQNQNYLVIGTLESFIKTAEYFSKDQVLPIYIEVDDGIRLERAIQRERRQETPKYEEMCRRFLADSRMMIWKDVYRKSKNICCLFCDDKKIKRFHHRKKIVTIQIPIRKTAAIRSLSFTHVVTLLYKLCQRSLRMYAYDVHIVIICMALNNYRKSI